MSKALNESYGDRNKRVLSLRKTVIHRNKLIYCRAGKYAVSVFV